MYSVENAAKEFDVELWVVDNASSDGSVEYLQPKFPAVHFISNEKNSGFAKANNQALKKCNGGYILFLNPDTLLPEDCISKTLSFIRAHPQAGALGVRMLDGSGEFLAESKRSFPHPFTSFFKLVGLSRLFPTSKIFSKYALGYLDEFKNHEVDVLAGAFMMVSNTLLTQLNGFDETYFMYGEDIDLSYRIQKAGYKNYYFSETSIIHFKGESTRKGSLNYTRMFYLAMSIFVRKHYHGSRASVFRFFVQIAIWLRAIFSTFLKLIVSIGMPLLDAVIIFASFELVTYAWIFYVREGHGFADDLLNISLPGFATVFIVTAWLAGIYDSRYRPARAIYAALIAITVTLAIYSLLPEKFRFSRGIILGGGLTALIFMALLRWFLLQWGVAEDDDETKKHHQTIVVATEAEYLEINELMKKSGRHERLIGRIAVNEDKQGALGTLADLRNLIESISIREIIFCKGFLSYSKIIDVIQQLPASISIRFHATGSESIVGSDSKDALGEHVSADGSFQLSHPYQKRIKKVMDVGLSLFILFTFPVQIFLGGFRVIQNALMVLGGRRTWIGYTKKDRSLPLLLQGILSTTGLPVDQKEHHKDESIDYIDYWYAKNYNWKHDLKIILKNYSQLGKKN